MMREIKFRAWDTQLKGYQHSGYGEKTFAIFAKRTNCGRFIIEQFTGLLDSNGVEIYEGDKVKSGFNTVGIVEWFNELTWDGGCPHPGFYCKEWTDYEEGELSYHEDFDNVEVIGNIHD